MGLRFVILFLAVLGSPFASALASNAKQQKKEAKASPKSNITKPIAEESKAPLSDEERDYARAQDLLKVGKEPEALISLTDFLRRYGTSHLAPDAQYLMGELYFRQRKFNEAASEFAKVFKYGMKANERAPWATLKIGECWAELKIYERARIEWDALLRKFPNSEAATQARSKMAGIP